MVPRWSQPNFESGCPTVLAPRSINDFRAGTADGHRDWLTVLCRHKNLRASVRCSDGATYVAQAGACPCDPVCDLRAAFSFFKPQTMIGAVFSSSGLMQSHRMMGISSSSVAEFFAFTLLVCSGVFCGLFSLSGSMSYAAARGSSGKAVVNIRVDSSVFKFEISDHSNLALCCDFNYHYVFQRSRLVPLVPAPFQSLPELTFWYISTSRLFPTLFFVRIYSILQVHIYPSSYSIPQGTLTHSQLFQIIPFFTLRPFTYSSFIRSHLFP